MIVEKKFKKVRLIVLKPLLNYDEAEKFVQQKKTNLFRQLLKKPDEKDVHVHSVELVYEPYLKISGIYSADFYRKATHPIKVDHNVQEVKLGEGIFPISGKSSLIKKIGGKYSKNTVEIDLEEHVFVENQDELIFDHHGMKSDVSYELDPKLIEKFPDAAIEQHKTKEFEITPDDAIKVFADFIREIKYDVRDLNEALRIDSIVKLYVPIYEARLIGPKKKVKIMRVDGVKEKQI